MSRKRLPYAVAIGIESVSGSGILGIEISIAHSAFEYDPRNEVHGKLRDAIHEAKEKIEQEMIALACSLDPGATKRAEAERDALLGCFPENSVVYVREIPNGYCRLACCRHLPWFEVTTTFGPVKVGVRKRVILLDWSASALKHRADDLFPNENVTKGDHDIHAWTVEDLRAYLATLYDNASRHKPNPYARPDRLLQPEPEPGSPEVLR